MFAKAFLIAIVTLSFLVSASPVVERDEGISIPLHKRTTLINANGDLDLDKAIAHTVFIKNKYRQNLINLERNVGKEAFNEVSRCFSSLSFPYIALATF
jgi:cathepsin D